MSNDFNKLANLIDNFRSEDLKNRVNSAKHLVEISNALGEERTIKELIPFINDIVDDEDEFILAIAEGLCNLNLSAQNAIGLKSIFEYLAGIEESEIRQKAVEGLCKILKTIGKPSLETEGVEMVRSLNSTENFSSKISSLGIIKFIFNQVSEPVAKELFTKYKELAASSVPQLRKHAAGILKDFIALIPKVNEKEVLILFNDFFKDDQDLVRALTIEGCIGFLKVIPFERIANSIYSYIKLFSDEKSWRIRFALADKFIELAEVYNKSFILPQLLPIFLNLLQDDEPEVRTTVASKIAKFCGFINDEKVIINNIIPLIKKLANDRFSYVRKSISENLLQIGPFIGSKNSEEFLVPIFLSLLKDECNELKLPLLHNLEEICKVIDIKTLLKDLLPVIIVLAQDKNWRIKISVLDYFPIISKLLDEKEFNDKLYNVIINMLSDRVFAIREGAINCISKIALVYGPKWFEIYGMPKIMAFKDNKNYLYRQNALLGIMKIPQNTKADYILKNVLPILSSLMNDKVANIRCNVAKCLKILEKIALNDASCITKIKSMLNTLANDSDNDVKFFVNQK